VATIRKAIQSALRPAVRPAILLLFSLLCLFPLGVQAQEEVSVLQSFDSFTRQWMEKLGRAEEFRRSQRMRVKKTVNGFEAEYTGYSLLSRKFTIKKTTSPLTPFIGILTYQEKVLRSSGSTQKEAIRGPFEVVETNKVMEVFRYTRGKWKY
jgi:hypothetical protein